jgi:hypothetical protein
LVVKGVASVLSLIAYGVSVANNITTSMMKSIEGLENLLVDIATTGVQDLEVEKHKDIIIFLIIYAIGTLFFHVLKLLFKVAKFVVS